VEVNSSCNHKHISAREAINMSLVCAPIPFWKPAHAFLNSLQVAIYVMHRSNIPGPLLLTHCKAFFLKQYCLCGEFVMCEKVTSAWRLSVVGRRANEAAEVSIRCEEGKSTLGSERLRVHTKA